MAVFGSGRGGSGGRRLASRLAVNLEMAAAMIEVGILFGVSS